MTFFVRELKFQDAKLFEVGLQAHLNTEFERGNEIFNVTILGSHAENSLRAVVVSRFLISSVESENSLKSESALAQTGRKKRDDLPANVGKPWDEESEKVLQELFAEGIRITEIAALLCRKPGGVRARLVKLGLVQPPEYLAPALQVSSSQAFFSEF